MLAPLGLEKGKPFRSPQPEINSSAQIRMNRLFSIDIEGVDPGYRNLRVGASATERETVATLKECGFDTRRIPMQILLQLSRESPSRDSGRFAV